MEAALERRRLVIKELLGVIMCLIRVQTLKFRFSIWIKYALHTLGTPNVLGGLTLCPRLTRYNVRTLFTLNVHT